MIFINRCVANQFAVTLPEPAIRYRVKGSGTISIPGLDSVDDEIDWGDGTKSNPTVADGSPISHSYSDGQEVHLVSISGGNSTKIGTDNYNAARSNSVTDILEVPSWVTSLGRYACLYNLNLLTVDLSSSSLETLNGFDNCQSLTQILLPPCLRVVGANSLSNCKSLASVALPDGVEEIGAGAFTATASVQNESALKSIYLGKSLKSIGSEAFAKCRKLESIDLPDTTTAIGDKAFSFCYLLTRFRMSSSIQSIGGSCFHYAADDRSGKLAFQWPGDAASWNGNPELASKIGTVSDSGVLTPVADQYIPSAASVQFI